MLNYENQFTANFGRLGFVPTAVGKLFRKPPYELYDQWEKLIKKCLTMRKSFDSTKTFILFICVFKNAVKLRKIGR